MSAAATRSTTRTPAQARRESSMGRWMALKFILQPYGPRLSARKALGGPDAIIADDGGEGGGAGSRYEK